MTHSGRTNVGECNQAAWSLMCEQLVVGLWSRNQVLECWDEWDVLVDTAANLVGNQERPDGCRCWNIWCLAVIVCNRVVAASHRSASAGKHADCVSCFSPRNKNIQTLLRSKTFSFAFTWTRQMEISSAGLKKNPWGFPSSFYCTKWGQLMLFRVRFCTSEANACVLTGAHFRVRLKRERLNQKNIINSLDISFKFHACVSSGVMEFERTEQSSITVTSGCHFPTSTLSWSGGAWDRRSAEESHFAL